ncbi:family 20 glycosylhydrolase [Lactobacillaceae bacterium Melli_B4]
MNHKSIIKSGLMILTVLLIIFGMHDINANAQTVHWHGLDYDEARNPANPNTLEKLIKNVAKRHGNYVKLHLTDDENFAIENQTIGQTIDKYHTQKDGLYYNSDTKTKFMSKAQLGALIQYGQNLNVTVIPEIDVPAHTVGLHTVLSHTNADLDKQVYDQKLKQLNYSDQQTQSFINQIFAEYLPLLAPNSPIGTGGDELIANGKSEQEALLKFDNQLASQLNGHQMWMYNDSARNATYKRLDKNIVIEYWSQTEDKSSAAVRKSNLKLNAKASSLLKNGHKLINTNSYYLYLLTEKKFITKANLKYYKNDLNKHWNENIFNERKNDVKVAKSKNIIGSSISIWQDARTKSSADTNIKKLTPWINAFFTRLSKQK